MTAPSPAIAGVSSGNASCWNGKRNHERARQYEIFSAVLRNDCGANPGLDWACLSQDLDGQGSAIVEGLLSSNECEQLTGLYVRDELFRSRVVMDHHGFGRGEYKYFAYPLPDIIASLRAGFYPYLVPMANRWNHLMGLAVRYPDTHAAFLARCHEAGPGQTDAALTAIWQRRLQLFTSGPVR